MSFYVGSIHDKKFRTTYRGEVRIIGKNYPDKGKLVAYIYDEDIDTMRKMKNDITQCLNDNNGNDPLKKYHDEATRLAINAALELLKWSINGMPECYLDNGKIKLSNNGEPAWLCDFYPGLPWDSGAIHSIKYLLEDKTCQECIQRFSKAIGFDMNAELKRALEIREKCYEDDVDYNIGRCPNV